MRTWTARLLGFYLLGFAVPACASKDPGTDSETHFVTCRDDADCQTLNPAFICVASRCERAVTPEPPVRDGGPGHTEFCCPFVAPEAGPDTGPGSDGTGGATDFDTGVRNLIVRSTDYILAGVTADGEAVALSRTGSSLDVALVDPTTNLSTPLGTLEGVDDWGGQATYDDKSHTIFAMGGDATHRNTLFEGQFGTGTLNRTTVLVESVDGGSGPYLLGGVSPQGLVAMGTQQASVGVSFLIDPVDGEFATQGGGTGASGRWGPEVTYDAKNGLFFRTYRGEDILGGQGVLDSIDAMTLNSPSQSYLPGAGLPALALPGSFSNDVLAGVTSSGLVIDAYVTGSHLRAELYDPQEASWGLDYDLGAIQSWSGQIAYGGDAHVLIAYATGPDGKNLFLARMLGQ